jgi:hypothetical protein
LSILDKTLTVISALFLKEYFPFLRNPFPNFPIFSRLQDAFYAKGALEEFKALSHTKVPRNEDLNQHHHHQEMEELEKKILKIFSEVPKGKYEDNLKQKVENAIITVGKATTFYDPKNPNEEHTAHESKMQMEDKKKMFEEWEQMRKFHTCKYGRGLKERPNISTRLTWRHL